MARDLKIDLRVDQRQLDYIQRLAKVAYGLGFIERPHMSELIQLGLSMVSDECQRIYLQARNQKGGA